MVSKGKISSLTISRLSIYLRALLEFQEKGKLSVSSGQIAKKVGSSAVQVRKDLSYFGSFGKKGCGYNIHELVTNLKSILGLDHSWKVALIGLGRMGESMVMYKGFRESGFEITAIFEKDPEKIGGKFMNIPIYSIDEMPEVCEKMTILIAIVTVPAEAAFEVFQHALDAGIRGLLNLTGQSGFIPPPHAFIKDVFMAAEIETLSYYLTNF